METQNNNTINIIEHLTNESFKEKVFDYVHDSEWNYKGSLPCLIDFYADWCKPCRSISQMLEELAEEYKGKLFIYKVDTEQEIELAALFRVQSIPTLLFVPVSGPPKMALGALPRESFVKAFREVLNVV
jgi:thioredoxin 1